MKGDYDNAVAFYEKALSNKRKHLGSLHSDITNLMGTLATIELVRKQPGRAFPYLLHLQKLHEINLTRASAVAQAAEFLDRHRWEEELTYSLLLQPQVEPEWRTAALTLALLRKGRAAQVAAQAGRAVLESLSTPEQRARFEQWQVLRDRKEQLYWDALRQLEDEESGTRLLQLNTQIQSLEQALMAESPVLRSLRPPRWDESIPLVASKLSAGGALVEIVWTRALSPASTGTQRKWSAPH
jgi:hypothetical protein